MKVHYLQLFRYNAWANERMIKALCDQDVEHATMFRLTGHMLAAEQIWLHRIRRLDPPADPLWGQYTITRLTEICESLPGRWTDYLNTEENFERTVTYRNQTGKQFTTALPVILTHVIHHGMYHRGQVAQHMRANGWEPAATDYIVWDREATGQL